MKTLHRLLAARVQVWELLLVALFVAVASYRPKPVEYPPPLSASEIDGFRAAYGPSHGTEREEEWFIRDFFKGVRNGTFLDAGANHYFIGNKTYYLEHVQGWSGLAIEPQTEFAADYKTHRPRTKFIPLFVSDVSDSTAALYILYGSRFVASADKAFVSTFGTPDEVRQVPTVTLSNLLDREGMRHIDFVSMDIELHEPQALKGFDVERFRPSLVCIEALLPVRQQILDYFARHAYVAVGRYLWVDRENLYFTPLDRQDTPTLGPAPSVH